MDAEKDAEIVVTHVADSTLVGTVQRFRKRRVLLGRRSANDVRFDKNRDLTVSGHHAELVVADGKLYVQDVGSRNGTFVNDQPVGERRLLHPDDVVTLGDPGAKIKAALRKVGDHDSEMETGDDAAKRKSVGMSTLGHVIDSVVRKERTRFRRVALSIVVLLFGLGSGVVALLYVQETRVRRQQEELRAFDDRQRQDLDRTKQELQLAGRQFEERLALTESSLQEVREHNEQRLRTSLAGLETQIEAIQGKLSEDETRISRLIVEIQERDQALARIQRNQKFTLEQKLELSNETQRQIDRLRRELEQTQEIARRDASDQGSWSELVETFGQSVFLCVGFTAADNQGTGTGFAIDDKGLLVTNAHVVNVLESHKQRFAIQNKTGRIFPILKTVAHPDHTDVRSPDVGLVRIDPGEARFTPFKIADQETLERLRIGTQLGTLGFPGELGPAYLRDFHPTKERIRTVQATFKDGWIGRITNYRFENDVPEFSRFIQHSASLSPGTSGSPMFNSQGEVVAINAGAIQIETELTVEMDGKKTTKKVANPSAAQIAFAIRADEVRQLRRDFEKR